MDLDISKQGINYNETVFNENCEQAVDCEFMLPDYCPDIERILKCSIGCRINRSDAAGSTVTVDGTAFIKILYADAKNGSVRGYEMPVSFTKVVDIKCNPDRSFARVTAKTDYVNCRAVNERKLDVHGAVSLRVKVTAVKEVQMCCNADGGELFAKKTPVSIISTAGVAEKQVVISEEIELGQSNGDILHIIRSGANAIFEECKIVANKAIIKGRIALFLLYHSGEERYEKFEYELPLNQIVEVNGLTDDTRADVKMTVIDHEIKPRNDMSSDSRNVTANIKLSVMVIANQAETHDIITDVYSTYCEIKCEREKMPFFASVHNIFEKCAVKETLELPDEGAEEIIDFWCTPINTSSKCENGELSADGECMCHLLYKNADGGCMYHEKTVNFSHTANPDIQQGFCECDIFADISDCGYTMAGGNKLDVYCNMSLSGTITVGNRHNVINSIEADETRLKKRDMAALTVYYADKGESVWNIAMRYNTSADMIMNANNLEEDVLTGRTVLLVPAV